MTLREKYGFLLDNGMSAIEELRYVPCTLGDHWAYLGYENIGYTNSRLSWLSSASGVNVMHVEWIIVGHANVWLGSQHMTLDQVIDAVKDRKIQEREDE